MLTEKETTKTSKFLSLILRHKPEEIGLTLDNNGWASVEELISRCNTAGIPLTRAALQNIVATNAKKRFAFNEDESKIRASQGHSIDVELGLIATPPPPVLHHGTATRFVASILQQGLLKQQRQHVHLSANIETATAVGQRHGTPFTFEVAAAQMFDDGHSFYQSENGVWLTDAVPALYLKEGQPPFIISTLFYNPPQPAIP